MPRLIASAEHAHDAPMPEVGQQGDLVLKLRLDGLVALQIRPEHLDHDRDPLAM